jgi:hypothetical protein
MMPPQRSLWHWKNSMPKRNSTLTPHEIKKFSALGEKKPSPFHRWLNSGGLLSSSRKERLKKSLLYPYMNNKSGVEGFSFAVIAPLLGLSILATVLALYSNQRFSEPVNTEFLSGSFPTAIIVPESTIDFMVTSQFLPSIEVTPELTYEATEPSSRIPLQLPTFLPTYTSFPTQSTYVIPTSSTSITFSGGGSSSFFSSPSTGYVLPTAYIPSLPPIDVIEIPVYVIVTATFLPTNLPTGTPYETQTFSPSPQATEDQTQITFSTQTATQTPIESETPSPLPISTETSSPTLTSTFTLTPTLTSTFTLTPTLTSTFTLTPTETPVLEVTP